MRAWITSMGRRTSLERVAHLMCELYFRARNVGLVSSRTPPSPLRTTGSKRSGYTLIDGSLKPDRSRIAQVKSMIAWRFVVAL
jgi:hypothetical protein